MRTTPGMHEPYWYPVYEYCQKNRPADHRPRHQLARPAHRHHPAELPDRLRRRAVHRHPAAVARRRVRALPGAARSSSATAAARSTASSRPTTTCAEGPEQQPVLRHQRAGHQLPRGGHQAARRVADVLRHRGAGLRRGGAARDRSSRRRPDPDHRRLRLPQRGRQDRHLQQEPAQAVPHLRARGQGGGSGPPEMRLVR